MIKYFIGDDVKEMKNLLTLMVQMKNWLPLVLGPAFAMLKIPGPVCFTAKTKHQYYLKQVNEKNPCLAVLTCEVFIFESGTVDTNTSSTL